MIRTLLALFAIFTGTALHAEEAKTETIGNVTVQSPDGEVHFVLNVSKTGVKYSVDRGDKHIVESSTFEARLKQAGSLTANLEIRSTTDKRIDETIELLWGKAKQVRNRCSETTVHFVNGVGVEWDLQLRAYDDGVAFRYGIPQQDALTSFEIEEETSEFRLAENPQLLLGMYDNFHTSHEPLYERMAIADVPPKKLIEMPMLATWSDGTAAAITEAGLRGFAGMYLQHSATVPNSLHSVLSPLPGKKGGDVSARPPCWSPWRVVLLADRAGQLIENNVLLCLNDPPTGDFSWAKPGKTTWHWWNGVIEHGTESNPDVNFAIHKKYIDFCAAHNIMYHAVIGVADSRPWYVQTGNPGYDPRPDTDILTPRPDLGMPKILDYAKEKGVGIRLWVYWKPLSEHLEEAFTKYEEWGIRGLMIDFMDRDDQEMVEWQEKVLQSAAKHHLHVQFHGSYKFSGEQRTYPNLFNREGVLNLEYLKWSDKCTPPHDVDIAYTRLLAGPVDYHLGGFRAVARDKFKPSDEKPEILGTRCHQLAMYVIFENPMPMVADYPEAYEGQPGFDFLEEVPTTWDETRFVAGEPGEFVVVARRSGDRWYLGGMNNWANRTVNLPLDFLGAGKFDANVRTDDLPDGSNPNEIHQQKRVLTSADKLELTLASGGGVAASFQPASQK